uniref:Uncharacterized protein n=1 Tax=Entomoneis paludosa TaxID=265537 RepID=A0A7S2YNK1_9STRA|mmetsp:Transcript_40520/g.84328  ORF Transcript_40520/g.84328 Transcript_40520/m.84328 type:complete len:311 (+) Transcript_40520:100-1032(+)
MSTAAYSPYILRHQFVAARAARILWLTLFTLGSFGVTLSDAYSLSGKRALVTGSSGGIGRGLALELARQGCEVLVHYHVREEGAHETAAIIAAQGGSCAGVLQCDFLNLTDMKDFQRSIDEIWPEGYDILVNNAGIIGKLALEDDDDDFSHFNSVMAVNLHAPRMLSHWAVPRMKDRLEGGVILHVSSIHGENSNEYMAAYAASKAALDSLTKTMAIEYAPHNIRVNAIAPGIVAVERTAEALSDPKNTAPWLDRLVAHRLGTVEDVAEASLPMLTNDWITGTIWKVDGGMMARSNMPKRDRPLKQGGVC